MSDLIKQSNFITSARYSFTEPEMKILIHVIQSVQDKLNSQTPIQTNLFGDIEYRLITNLDHIDQNNSHMIKRALGSLRKKSFEVNNGKSWLETGFLSGSMYDDKTKKYDIRVSSLLMPYLISVAQGFTTYQLNTVLYLNPIAKRIYMACAQFADTGIFRVNADLLRQNLGLEEKYPLYKTFKSVALGRAIDEINKLYDEDKCDLRVEIVSDKKEKHKDDFDRTIEFKIHSVKRKSHVKLQQAEKVDLYAEIGGMISAIFKEDFTLGDRVYSHFSNRSDSDLSRFHKRLSKICDEAEANNTKIDMAYILHIVQSDYGFIISNKAKTEKKSEDIAAILAKKFTSK